MSLQHSVTYKNWRLTYMITASDSIEIVKGEPAGGLFSFSPKSLETLEISQTIKGYQVIGIGEEAFRLTPEKTPSVVVLPDTIEYIRKRAFISCRNLRLIKLPQGLKEIGSHAFRDCINLQAAEFFSADDYSVPVTRLKIGEGAFWAAASLPLLMLIPLRQSAATDSGNVRHWKTYSCLKALLILPKMLLMIVLLLSSAVLPAPTLHNMRHGII